MAIDQPESGGPADPIRVLHVIKGLGPGGAEQLLVNQARATRATPGNRVDFFAAYLVPVKRHLVPTLEAEGWTVRCLDSPWPWQFGWVLELRRMIKRHGIQVVHGHSPLVAAVTRLMVRTLPRRYRPATVYTEHNEWGRHRRSTRLANRVTIGREDRVFAVSGAVRQTMPPGLDVEVLIHGVDVEAISAQRAERDQVRQELGIEPHDIVVGIVANFRREKAYDILMDAAERAVQAESRLRIVSVGQGPLEEEMRARHTKSGLGDRFMILGYRPDAVRVMSGFDIFTLSSLHEGLPVALMEAMALDLPVVSTRVGGIAEAVRDWPAILVEPGDAPGLAAALVEMAGALPRPPTPAGAEGAPVRFDARSAAATLSREYLEQASHRS